MDVMYAEQEMEGQLYALENGVVFGNDPDVFIIKS